MCYGIDWCFFPHLEPILIFIAAIEIVPYEVEVISLNIFFSFPLGTKKLLIKKTICCSNCILDKCLIFQSIDRSKPSVAVNNVPLIFS
jgi:hypothetical protein